MSIVRHHVHHVMPGTVSAEVNPNWYYFITGEDFGLTTNISAPTLPTQGLRMQDTLYTTPNGWDAFITAEDFGSTTITAPANPTQAQEPI